MRDTSISAREVAEDLLRRTGDSLLAGDFEEFACHFRLPALIETFEGKSILETENDLRTVFCGAHEYYARHNLEDLYRNCVEANYRDDDTIESTHETRLISHGVLIIPPFPVFSILRRFDRAWKIVQSSYAVSQADEFHNALMARSEYRST